MGSPVADEEEVALLCGVAVSGMPAETECGCADTVEAAEASLVELEQPVDRRVREPATPIAADMDMKRVDRGMREPQPWCKRFRKCERRGPAGAGGRAAPSQEGGGFLLRALPANAGEIAKQAGAYSSICLSHLRKSSILFRICETVELTGALLISRPSAPSVIRARS